MGIPPGPWTGDIDPSDTDPWPNVLKDAKSGDHKTLAFETSAAQDCASHCATALGQFLALQQKAGSLGTLPDFSQWLSGSLLPMEFNNAAGDLGRALGAHSKVLDEMGQTFIQAGRNYDTADDTSADHLKKVDADWASYKMPTAAAALPNESSNDLPDDISKIEAAEKKAIDAENKGDQPDGSSVPDYPKSLTMPAEMMDFEGTRMNVPPELDPHNDHSEFILSENPTSMGWNDLHQLGQMAGQAVKPVWNTYTDWNYIAGQVQNTYQSFIYNVVLSLQDQWSGSGSDGALKAIQKYQDNARALKERTKVIAANLNYAAHWLSYTHLTMPLVDEQTHRKMLKNAGYDDGQIDSAITSMVKTAQTAMKTYYVQGVEDSSSTIPAIQSPPIPPPPPATPATPATPAKPAKPSTPATPSTPALPSRPSYPGPGPANNGLQAANAKQQAQMKAEQEKYAKQMQDEMAKERQQAQQQADQQKADQQKQEAQQKADQQQQAAQQAAQQAMQAGQQAVQQAVQAAQQAGQQGLTDAQKSAQDAALAGLGSMPNALAGLADGGLGADLAKLGGGGGGLGDLSKQAVDAEAQASKLFPRAGLATSALGEELGAARGVAAGAAAAQSSPGAGYPGQAGRNAGGAGDGKDHKRPAYLESAKHLEDALGEAPQVVRPIVDQ